MKDGVTLINADGDMVIDSSIIVSDGDTFVDNNGNEIIEFTVTASALNHVGIANAGTGVSPVFVAEGEANTGFLFTNSEAEEILVLNSIATSVNQLEIRSSATGNNVVLLATGDDDTVGINITGKAGGAVTTAGGTLVLDAGAGNTTGAGGAISVTGGAGGNDAVGGMVTVAGGDAGGGNRAGGLSALQGGAGSGTAAGGNAQLLSGTGANGAGATAGGDSGAVVLQNDTAGTSATGTGGSGGDLDLTGGDGGATTGVAGVGGDGSSLSITAGNGGNDGEGSAGTGGNGGSIVIAPGTGGTGNTAGSNGIVSVSGFVLGTVLAAAAKTTSTTLTVQEILAGMITANQGASGAATYTTPTGTQIDSSFPAAFLAVGTYFELTVTNISTDAAEDATMAGGVGVTAIGAMVVASNAAATDKSAGIFRFVRTGANAWNLFRIS